MILNGAEGCGVLWTPPLLKRLGHSHADILGKGKFKIKAEHALLKISTSEDTEFLPPPRSATPSVR